MIIKYKDLARMCGGIRAKILILRGLRAAAEVRRRVFPNHSQIQYSETGKFDWMAAGQEFGFRMWRIEAEKLRVGLAAELTDVNETQRCCILRRFPLRCLNCGSEGVPQL